MADWWTHQEVEKLCDSFMHRRRRVRARLTRYPRLARVDRVYLSPGEIPLVCEIKPERADHGEIKKGIGQAVCCLPFRAATYLVLLQETWDEFKDTLLWLPWLGVLVYQKKASGSEQLEEVRKSVRKNLDTLPGLNVARIKSKRKLTKEKLQSYLSERLVIGQYSIRELREILAERFPYHLLSDQRLGSILSQLGYKKKRLRPGGPFCYEIYRHLDGETAVVEK